MRIPDYSMMLKWFFRNTSVGIFMMLTSKLAMSLYITPGHASTVFTSAGIALAGMLIFGKKVWPGIFIATLLISIETLSQIDGTQEIVEIWLISSFIGLSAVLQAVTG